MTDHITLNFTAVFNFGDLSIRFDIDIAEETVWATQQQIADLFDVDRSVVAKHIKNVYSDGELEAEATCAKFAQVRSEGGRDVTRHIEHYNLDMILSVGYRVNSPKATKFRQWATRLLRAYLTRGYVLNEARLQNDPEALLELSAEIRALRESEKSWYHAVRGCFKKSAVDYDKNSELARMFYARLQNTFHYAITRKTAAGLILDRAHHDLPNMGLQSNKPTKDNVKVAKNYLRARELRRQQILSEHFLLFAEDRAERGQETTMQQLLDQFNRLLEAGEYPILPPGPDYRSGKAEKHAQAEYAQWSVRQPRLI